jgi:hypothetical protein
MNPDDIGGSPATMPSNDWWTSLTTSLEQDAEELAQAATVRAATSGRIGGATPNYPPGQGGINPQAASVPGGVPALTRNLQSLGVPAQLTSGAGLLLLLGLGYLLLKKFL